MPTPIGPYIVTPSHTFYFFSDEGSESWAGPAIVVSTRPGVPGIGVTEDGFRGEPFTKQFKTAVSSASNAQALKAVYMYNKGCFCTYYDGTGNYMANVLIVDIQNIRHHKIGGGAGTFGLSYALNSNLWVVESTWTLQHGATSF